MNRANLGYTLEVNHLADRTEEELHALRGRKHSGVYNGGRPFPYNEVTNVKVPEEMDWRLYGAVTPVKGEEEKNHKTYYRFAFSASGVKSIINL